ncbi:hypothetical protein OKW45_004395 [Paraburkholderia sp. WSM4175]|uniref:hypothetical protein n=1 Tax=Paraburkholderia sp. WSM4175 TaxID=2991072 RepID=UPI003D194DF1
MIKHLIPVAAQAFDPSDVADNAASFDMVVCAVSGESRALKVPGLIKASCGRKIAIRVQTHDRPSPRASSVYERAGFEYFIYDESAFRSLLEACSAEGTTEGSNRGQEPFRILVDVSCLPRRIVASMFAALASQGLWSEVDLWLIYNPARYVPPATGSLEPNRRVAPVHPVFAGWISRAGLPVRTVVGLGYERGKALGAVEYIQSSDYVLFIPESPEKRYRAKVEQHNRQLIRAASDAQVFDYDVLQPVETFQMLGGLVAGMKGQYKPVLLPFGPKILFAVSLLVALVHREVSVWHVSGEELEQPVERPGSSYFATIRVRLSAGRTNLNEVAF